MATAGEEARPTQGRVVLKMLSQAAVPAMVATGYAAYMYSSDPKSSILTFFNTFGVAFFLAMWFVGQYIRTSKLLDDAHYLETLNEKVDHIASTVKTPSLVMAANVPSEGSGAPLGDPVSATLIDEARTALDAGHVYSGLTTAGVAFEHALQQAALRLDVPTRDRDSPSRLVESLSAELDRAVVEELHELRIARTALEHLTEERTPDKETSLKLWEAYRWGIQQAESVKPPPPDRDDAATAG